MEKISHNIPNGNTYINITIRIIKNLAFVQFQVQFIAIFTHQFQLLFRDCDYPKGFMVWIGLHGIMFLFLFSDFYKTKYSKNKAHTKTNGTSNGSAKISYTHAESNGKDGACMVSKFFV